MAWLWSPLATRLGACYYLHFPCLCSGDNHSTSLTQLRETPQVNCLAQYRSCRNKHGAKKWLRSESGVPGSYTPPLVLMPLLGVLMPFPTHMRTWVKQSCWLQREVDHVTRTGWASTAGHFHFIVCKLFFGKQEDKKPKEKRSMLSQEDKERAGALHRQELWEDGWLYH